MKRFAALLGLICLLFQDPVSGSEIMLDRLIGSWKGGGTVRGMRSEQTMVWTRVLNGQFTRLEFDNRMKVSEDQVFHFQAQAYYRVNADGEIAGHWYDSRGVSFPLKGSQTPCRLTIEWGSPESETGRTGYHLSDEQLEVIDEVRDADGNWRVFGKSVLQQEAVVSE